MIVSEGQFRASAVGPVKYQDRSDAASSPPQLLKSSIRDLPHGPVHSRNSLLASSLVSLALAGLLLLWCVDENMSW